MVLSIFKKSKASIEQIDVVEAFNIWNLLNARYESIENAQVYRNFIHDRDFDIVLNQLAEGYQGQVKVLENEIENHKLKAPVRPPQDFKTSVQADVIADKFIYGRTLSELTNELFSLNRSFRSSQTSERLRKIIREFLFAHLKQLIGLEKYGKLKGWSEVLPSYKTAKPLDNEQLSLGSAFHIWDHLRQRYYQLELTMLFEGITHDIDFKAGMALAVKTLQGQIKKLEQLALKNEIPITERNPASMKIPVDPEVMEDRFMYQQIYLGIDYMLDMHIRAIIETTKNDEIRELFLEFFNEECDAFDRMVKLGKAKGWLAVPPPYNPNLG